MEKPISNKDVYYLLIGAFSLFFLIEISYSIGYITKTLLIMSNQNSLLTFILKEGLEVFTLLKIANNALKGASQLNDVCLTLCSLSKDTKRREIAAGVTPEILEACPTDAGLTLESFSATSLEKPLIWS